MAKYVKVDELVAALEEGSFSLFYEDDVMVRLMDVLNWVEGNAVEFVEHNDVVFSDTSRGEGYSG